MLWKRASAAEARDRRNRVEARRCNPRPGLRSWRESSPLCGRSQTLASRVVAVDYSKDMLNAAQRKAEANAWSNIEFRQTDGACLELPEASLEGAICTFGLSAMSDESAS
ncbi:MAG: class I SAM-dependent methyltransferase [Candidatus Sulfotelmatobacter sp.]